MIHLKNDCHNIYNGKYQIMQSLDLRKLTSGISDDTFNVLEIFVCKKASNDTQINVRIPNIQDDVVRNIESRFSNAKDTTFKAYYMRDKIYTYEMGNDNQIVSSKHHVLSQYISRPRKSLDLFLIASKIDKYPVYIFPCTNEIDHICEYTIREYKINNRVSIVIRTEEDFRSVYIEYRHSPNVDIDRMNETVNRLLKIM